MIANIRIEPRDETHFKIFVNDEDVSHYVRVITFKAKAGELPVITLEIPAALSIPENIKANLSVFIPKDEE